MTFSEFAQLLYPILADGRSVENFTRDLLFGIVNIPTEDGVDKNPISDLTGPAFKAYFRGTNRLSRLAPQINGYIDRVQFEGFFEDASDDAIEQLCKLMKQYCGDVDQWTVKEKIALLFQDVLLGEAVSNKRTKTKGQFCSPHTTNMPRENTSAVQVLQENSREEFSRLQGLLKYKVEPKLVSTMDTDITKYNQILLVGDGGAGKTSFLLDYWGKLLSNDSAETKSIPIYVPLNRFEGNDKSFIHAYIQEQYFKSIDALGFDNWVKSAENCDVILLLDAINEAKNSRELGPEIETLCSLGCKIIITSRYDMEGWGSLENFKRVHLLPLSETIVDDQLKEQNLEISERLRPFLTKPMYLALLLKLGEVAKEVESPGELLLAHHERVQQTFDVDKHGVVYHKIGKIAFDYVLPELAGVIESLRFAVDNKLEAIINSHFEKKGWDCESVLNLLVESGILIAQGYNRALKCDTYIFSHEHYLDFYKAYGIYREMQEGNVPQVLRNKLISNDIAAFLGDLWREYKFENKTDCHSELSPIEAFMQKHLRNTGNQESRIAIRNLVETMKTARRNNITANYSGLDTSLCNFFDCVLSNSLFIGSVVSQNSFTSNGHTDYIHLLAYSPKNNQLLTASCHGESVLVWDTSTGELIDEIPCAEKVLDIDVSLDDQRFLILSENFVTVINFEDPSESYSLQSLDTEGNRQQITFAKFLEDPTRIICATSDGYLKILDALSGFEYTSEPIDNWSNEVFELYALSQNRKILASVRQAGGITIRKTENLSKSIPINPPTTQDTFRIFGVAVFREDYVAIAGWKKFLAFSIERPNTPPITIDNPFSLWGSFVDTNTGISCAVVDGYGFASWDIMQNRLTTIEDVFSADDDTMVCAVGLTISHDKSLIIASDINQKIHFYNTDKNKDTHQFWAGFSSKITSSVSEKELAIGADNYLLRKTWAGKIESLSVDSNQVRRIDFQGQYSIIKGTYVYVNDRRRDLYEVFDMCTGKIVLTLPQDWFSSDTIAYKARDRLILDTPGSIHVRSLVGNMSNSTIEGKTRWIEKNPQNKPAYPQARRNDSFWGRVKQFSHPYVDEDYTQDLDVEVTHTLTPHVPNRDLHTVVANLGIVVGGMLDGSIKTWNLDDGYCKMSLDISDSAIIRVSSIEGTQYVVAQSEDAHVYVIDILAKELLLDWTDENWSLKKAVFVGFFPTLHSNGNTVLSDTNAESILSLSSIKGSLIAYIPKSEYAVHSISRDRTKIAVCNSSLFSGACISVYDVISRTERVVVCDKTFSLGAWMLSESGNTLLISSNVGDVFSVNIETEEVECAWKVINARDIWMCDFSNAIIKGGSHFTDILKLNGAITDNSLGKPTYDAAGLFEFY